MAAIVDKFRQNSLRVIDKTSVGIFWLGNKNINFKNVEKELSK